VGHVVHIGEMRSVYRIVVGYSEGKISLSRSMKRLNMYLAQGVIQC
jgi:hypothetical protein